MDTSRAKAYALIRYSLSFAETLYMLVVLTLFMGLGWSQSLADMLGGNSLFGRAAFLLVVFLLYSAVSFPFTFYHSFLLEHQFGLSKQSFKAWAIDQLKSGAVGYVIVFIMLAAFYWVLGAFPGNWWLVVAGVWMAFNFLLTLIFPVLIMPLFFKFKPVSDQPLKERILALSKKMGVPLMGVFEIDMSKKTAKANAGLMGWGRSRRVVLGDTLNERYTPDEIEVILAHEFAHQKLCHVLKLLLANSVSAAVCLYVIFATRAYALAALGLSSMSDTAAMPLVAVYFVLYGIVTQPIHNLISRIMERNADEMALRYTGMKDAFVSTMQKLSDQNLSDPSPNALVKAFFFDHPPTAERIEHGRNHPA